MSRIFMHLRYNSEGLQLEESMDVNMTKKTLNLEKKRLRIASVESEPYQTLELINDSIYVGKGFSFEVVNHLSEHFNFTYDVVIPTDLDFGMLINGSYWTGMIGMLLNETADMAAAPISITQERQKVVTFGTVLLEDTLGFLFAKPQDRQNSRALIAPFSTTVWITVLLIALMMCPILYVLVCLSTWVQRQRKRRMKFFLSFGDCVWFVYSGLMKQGYDKSSTLIPVRLLMAAWWLTSLLIAAFYTANLTAFLTTESSISVPSVRDVYELGYRWTFKKGTAFSNKLLKDEKLNNGDEFFLLRESLRKDLGKSVSSEEKAMEHAQEGYAYIQEVNILNYLLFRDFKKRRGYCQYHVFDLNIFKHSAAFAFPKGSPYALHFSEYMEDLRKSGLIQKWMSQHLSKADVCTVHHDNKLSQEEQALTLNDVYTAFYLLLIGVFVSLICFISERYTRKCKKYWGFKFGFKRK